MIHADFAGLGLSWVLTAVAMIITTALIAYRIATRHRRRPR